MFPEVLSPDFRSRSYPMARTRWFRRRFRLSTPHTSQQSRRRSYRPEVESLEARWLPSTITLIRTLGAQAQYGNSATTFDITTSGAVAAGHSILVEFAMKAASGTVTAYTHLAGSPTPIDTFTVDADVTNPNTGGTVRTLILSTHGVHALPSGSLITITFPSSKSQAASAIEVAG